MISLSKIEVYQNMVLLFQVNMSLNKGSIVGFVAGHHVLQSLDRVDNIMDTGGKRSIRFPHPETSQFP